MTKIKFYPQDNEHIKKYLELEYDKIGCWVADYSNSYSFDNESKPDVLLTIFGSPYNDFAAEYSSFGLIQEVLKHLIDRDNYHTESLSYYDDNHISIQIGEDEDREKYGCSEYVIESSEGLKWLYNIVLESAPEEFISF